MIAKTDLQDLINFRVGGSGKQDWFRPNLEKGHDSTKYRIRVCPPGEGETVPFYSTKIHYFRYEEGGERRFLSGVCPTVADEPCPACARFWGVRDSVEDDVKKALRDLGAQTRIYCNVIDRGEQDPQVKVWGMSFNVGTDIVDNFQAYAEEGMDLSDPKKGYDFIISLKRRGSSFNYGSVARAPKSSPIGVEGWAEQLHSLHGMAHQRELTADDIDAILPDVLGTFYGVIEDTYQKTTKKKDAPAEGGVDLSAMSVADLRAVLRDAGNPTSGKKDALIKRIKTAGGLDGLGEKV